MAKRVKRILQAYAGKKRGKYTIEIHGQGFTAKQVGALFEAIQTTQDDDALMTFPVIRELEDPKLMARLDKAVADIKSGKVKTIPWEEVKKELFSKGRSKKR